MNFKTTIILLVILAIGLGAWFLFFPAATEDESVAVEMLDASKPEYVFDPQPETEDIVRVEVERPGEQTIVFEREPTEDEQTPPGGARWQIVEPLAVSVEDYAVRSLITTLRNLESWTQFEPGTDGELTAADAGLEPPAATITLVDAEDKKYALEVGRQAIMSNDTYVRIAGETTVRVAKRDLKQQVNKDVNDYRSKRLVKLNTDEVVGIHISHAGKTYDFTRGPDGQWVINEPQRAYADRDRIRSLITKFNAVPAAEFSEDSPTSLTPFGLDEPFLTFTVTTETKRKLPTPEGPETQPAESQYETVTDTQKLAFGGFADLKSEKRYAKPGSESWVITVTSTTIDGLIPNLKDLRDPRVTRVKASDATVLEVASGGSSATLRKVDGVWQGTGDLAALETSAVTDLLEAFEDLRAIDYVDDPRDPAEYGLHQPRATITVTAAGSVTPVSIQIGSATPSGRNAYVKRDQERTVIVTSAAQADRLAVDLLSLRSREIFNFPADQLHRVSIQRPAMNYELVRENERWRLSEPTAAPLEVGNVRKLTNDLSRLRAGRVVGKGDEAAFGLTTPLMTIQFEVAQPPATTQPTTTQATQATQPTTAEAPVVTRHTLRIGRKDGVAYARQDDDPYIFELHDTVYQVMVAELIDQRLFRFRPDDVVALKVVATGGTLELSKEGQQWIYTPDPYVELAQTKVKEFIEDLSRFRAEAYFAYRDGDLAAEGLIDAPASVTIRLTNGHEIVMNMTQERPGRLPRKAALVAEKRIFRMRQADCEKLLRGLDDYVKVESTSP